MNFDIHPTKIILRIPGEPDRLIEWERFDELLARAGKEFSEGRDIGGPKIPKLPIHRTETK